MHANIIGYHSVISILFSFKRLLCMMSDKAFMMIDDFCTNVKCISISRHKTYNLQWNNNDKQK